MALTKTMTMQAFGQSVTVPDAYIKVAAVNVTKSNANAFVFVFANDRTTVIEQSQHMFTPALTEGSSNFISQAYDHLKTLDQFAGAVDVVDSTPASSAAPTTS